MTATSPAIATSPALPAVLVTPRRPAPPAAAAASLSFAWRALIKIRRVPVQLFDIAVHPVVFTLMFTYLFGGALGGSTGRYLTYLLPGILVMTLLVTTGSTGSALSTTSPPASSTASARCRSGQPPRSWARCSRT